MLCLTMISVAGHNFTTVKENSSSLSHTFSSFSTWKVGDQNNHKVFGAAPSFATNFTSDWQQLPVITRQALSDGVLTILIFCVSISVPALWFLSAPNTNIQYSGAVTVKLRDIFTIKASPGHADMDCGHYFFNNPHHLLSLFYICPLYKCAVTPECKHTPEWNLVIYHYWVSGSV